jgi:hypothetical protein
MRIFPVLFFIFLSLTNFAQNKSLDIEKKGNRRYVDFVAGLDPNIAILDGNTNTMLSGYVYFLFINKIYTGIYNERKIGVTSANYTIISKFKGGNLHYADAGAYIGKFFVLTKGKDQRMPGYNMLWKINFALKLGVGRIWIINKSNNKLYDRINYLLIINPNIGVEYPLSKVISAGFGVNYRMTLNSYVYYKNSDLCGLGAYVNIRFSILNNAKVKGKTRL